MFPLNWNIPFIRKNGSRTTLGAITGDIAGIEEDIAELAADIADIPFLNNTNKTTAGFLSGTSATISSSLTAIGLNANIAFWTWLQGLPAYYSNPNGIQICVAGNQMNASGTTTQMWKDVLNIFGLSALQDPWLEINITAHDAGRGYLKVTTNDCVTRILYFTNWAKSGNVYTLSMT